MRDEISFQYGTIPGAKRMEAIEQLAEEGRLDRSKAFVLFCMHGIQSREAAETLREQGYDCAGISGGKDSMLMAKLFQELKKHRKFEFDIFDAVYRIEKSPCYLCARMRRGHLYSKAREPGCMIGLLALVQHFIGPADAGEGGFFPVGTDGISDAHGKGIGLFPDLYLSVQTLCHLQTQNLRIGLILLLRLPAHQKLITAEPGCKAAVGHEEEVDTFEKLDMKMQELQKLLGGYDEDRFLLLGMSTCAKICIVCHCYRAADSLGLIFKGWSKDPSPT